MMEEKMKMSEKNCAYILSRFVCLSHLFSSMAKRTSEKSRRVNEKEGDVEDS